MVTQTRVSGNGNVTVAKASVWIKVIDEHGVVTEWQGVYDLDTTTTNGGTRGLLDRIRILVRREFIRRSLMVGTQDDRAK